MSKTIPELAIECHQIAVDRGWHEEPRTFGDFIALIHSEVTEAVEAYEKAGTDCPDCYVKGCQARGCTVRAG